MTKALRPYENWSIRTGYLTGNLLDGQEVEGIDEEASIERYREQFRADLEAEYPGADIEITAQEGSGYEGYNLRTRVTDADGEPSIGEEQHVDSIAGHLWGNFDRWIVEETA